MLLMLIIMLSFFLATLLMFLGHLLCLKIFNDINKVSPYECGFLSKENSWTPFSMQFFMSALIFLIFDIELVLLFPYIMTLECKMNTMMMSCVVVFLIFLSVGFVVEWSQKMLDWQT